MATKPTVYYVKRTPSGMLELRQTRFIGQPDHPHDVCAVARDEAELRGMVDLYLKGTVDWSGAAKPN